MLPNGNIGGIPKGAMAYFSHDRARAAIFVLAKPIPVVEVMVQRDVVAVQLDLSEEI